MVFVGDSWTFGLGVSQAEAFPRQLEGLARRHGAHNVEAWSLALPGYNLLNQVAALETFADLLQPDAVVVCLTINDINSSQAVLANGSLGRAGQLTDDFGSPVALELRSRIFDSHLFIQRWRRVMSELARAERRFERRGVPIRRLRAQLSCGIDHQTGVMGRSSAVFLRRHEGRRNLLLKLRRVGEGSSVYPLELTVTIPSASGGVTHRLIVAAEGPSSQGFAVELPSDLGSATAIDVLLEAERVGIDPSGVMPWSVVVDRIWQGR